MNTWEFIRNFVRPPLTGRHVLVLIITFFSVIFAVNGVFVYVSLQTHPGVTSPDAYRKGLRYNVELDRADRQNARGWKAEITATAGVLELHLSDKEYRPITGMTVDAVARRPVHDRADTKIVLEEIDAGRYRGTRAPLSPGRWNLIVTASRGNLSPYRIEYSVQVRK